jgi:hypothetical protein
LPQNLIVGGHGVGRPAESRRGCCVRPKAPEAESPGNSGFTAAGCYFRIIFAQLGRVSNSTLTAMYQSNEADMKKPAEAGL